MQQKMRFQVYMKPPLEMKAREILAEFVARILRGGHIFEWEILHGTSDFNQEHGLNNQIIIDLRSDHYRMIREAMEAKLTNLNQQGFISYWRVSYKTITAPQPIFQEKTMFQFPEMYKVPSPSKPEHLGPFWHRKTDTFRPMWKKEDSTYSSRRIIEQDEKELTSEKVSPQEGSKETNNYLINNISPHESKETIEKQSSREKKSTNEKKPKKYLTAYEAFWLDSGQLKQLRKEFDIILV